MELLRPTALAEDATLVEDTQIHDDLREKLVQVVEAGDRQQIQKYLFDLLLAMSKKPGDDNKAVIQFLKEDIVKGEDDAQSWLMDMAWLLWDQFNGNDELRKGLAKTTKMCIDLQVVPKFLAMERLQEDFAAAVNLVASVQAWKKTNLKFNTKKNYKQIKFNMMREETEGYSKLVTDLEEWFTRGADQSQIISRLQSVIGYFNLDPNRVIDVALNVYESTVAMRKLPKREADFPNLEVFLSVIGRFNPDHVCDMLGFQFQHYLRPQVEDYTPVAMCYVAAILIKKGIVSLEKLYSHLGPSDEEGKKLRTAYRHMKFKEAQKIGSVNLNVDSAKQAKIEEKEAGARKEALAPLKKLANAAGCCGDDYAPPNQKVELLAALLTVGDWERSKMLFYRLKALEPESNDRVGKALCRHLHLLLEPLYAPHATKHRIISTVEATVSMDDGGVDIASDDALQSIQEVTAMLKHHISRDIPLFCKLCRVMKAHIEAKVQLFREQAAREAAAATTSTPEVPNKADTSLFTPTHQVERVFAECLLPALSTMDVNTGVASDLWDALSVLPYQTRFALYGYWDHALYSQSIELRFAQAKTTKEAKYFQKRIANSKTKDWGRKLVKFTANNPLVVMKLLLKQIQSYNNLIPAVIDSLKFLNRLDYDVIVFLLVRSFSVLHPDKIKTDGVHLADWFKFLASFTGQFYKKYHEYVTLDPMLKYVENKLKDGFSVDLIILTELIQQMVGIEITENATDAFIESQGGGPRLQSEMALRNARVKKRPAAALIKSLKSNELIFSFFVLIAQQKEMIIYHIEAEHLQFISEMYDKCQGALMQFNELITSNKRVLFPGKKPTEVDDAYASLFPPLVTLCAKYHLTPEAAFFILRPVILHEQICRLDLVESRQDSAPSTPVESPGSTCPTPSEPSKESAGMDIDEEATTTPKGNADAGEAGAADTAEGKAETKAAENPLTLAARHLLPADTWKHFSPDLYSTFWSLSMYDLHVPIKQYEAQIAKLKKELDAVKHSNDDEKKRKREKDKLQDRITHLEAELRDQQRNHTSVMKRLRSMKDTWLTGDPTELCMLVQHCVLPRCMSTSVDAMYCAKFLLTLFELDTPHFHVPFILHQLFDVIPNVLSSCTLHEATRFGRCMHEILRQVNHWANASVYKKESTSKWGFSVSVRVNDQTLPFDKYIKLYRRWHNNLQKMLSKTLSVPPKTAMNSLISRVTLLFLNRIAPEFPRTPRQGNALVTLLNTYTKDTGLKGSALQLLANGVLRSLEDKRSSWMDEAKVYPGVGVVRTVSAPTPTKSADAEKKAAVSTPSKSKLNESKSTPSAKRSKSAAPSSQKKDTDTFKAPASKKRDDSADDDKKKDGPSRSPSSSSRTKRERSSSHKRRRDEDPKDSDRRDEREKSHSSDHKSKKRDRKTKDVADDRDKEKPAKRHRTDRDVDKERDGDDSKDRDRRKARGSKREKDKDKEKEKQKEDKHDRSRRPHSRHSEREEAESNDRHRSHKRERSESNSRADKEGHGHHKRNRTTDDSSRRSSGKGDDKGFSRSKRPVEDKKKQDELNLRQKIIEAQRQEKQEKQEQSRKRAVRVVKRTGTGHDRTHSERTGSERNSERNSTDSRKTSSRTRKRRST